MRARGGSGVCRPPFGPALEHACKRAWERAAARDGRGRFPARRGRSEPPEKRPYRTGGRESARGTSSSIPRWNPYFWYGSREFRAAGLAPVVGTQHPGAAPSPAGIRWARVISGKPCSCAKRTSGPGSTPSTSHRSATAWVLSFTMAPTGRSPVVAAGPPGLPRNAPRRSGSAGGPDALMRLGRSVAACRGAAARATLEGNVAKVAAVRRIGGTDARPPELWPRTSAPFRFT